MSTHHTSDAGSAEKHRLWCELLPKPDILDAKAKQWVLNVLAKDAIAKVEFTVTGLKFSINPEMLRQIALRVKFDDIRVYERDGGSAQLMDWFDYIDLPSDAAYFSDLDVMVVRASGSDIYHEAIVVHECVHAVLDMMGDRNSPLSVTTALSESVAYIAQALFARASYAAIGYPDKSNPFVDDSDAVQQQVFDTAWTIAGKILGGAKRVDAADLAAMTALIPTTTTYKHKPTDIDFNGIALRGAACV